jgi:hypothetical protein
MTDPVVTDASKVLADIKAVSASLVTDEAKVKVFWADYRTYIVCGLCLILGIVVGHSVHL